MLLPITANDNEGVIVFFSLSEPKTAIKPFQAAALHDTVEDTDTTIADIRRHFGSSVANLVAQVTDDRSLPKRKAMQVRKARHMSDGAKQIKLADKIANVSDLIYAPPIWSKSRMQAYVNFASQRHFFLHRRMGG